MLTFCWSPKGGSGTTVVAAALAILSARHAPTVLLDLGGDAPAALGLGDAGAPGVLDWLDAPHATTDELFRLGTSCTDDLRLVGRGVGDDRRALSGHDWDRLVDAVEIQSQDVGVDVVVDCGSMIPPDLATQADRVEIRSLLVLRPCYLALRRAVQRTERSTGIVIVQEPGRALGRNDVERALSLPVVVELPWDPAVARAVDAGLLASRLPQTLGRPLRGLALGALR